VISEQQSSASDGSAQLDPDAVLAALADAVAVLDRLARSAGDMIDNADAVAALRRDGRAWTDVLATEEARRLTTTLAESAEAVGRANSEVRRAAVVALYSTGLSMQAIGQLLGVSRQRIAVVLRAATTRNGQTVAKPSSKQH
jgi:DNA-binding NarL/FixJ family response regulator